MEEKGLYIACTKCGCYGHEKATSSFPSILNPSVATNVPMTMDALMITIFKLKPM